MKNLCVMGMPEIWITFITRRNYGCVLDIYRVFYWICRMDIFMYCNKCLGKGETMKIVICSEEYVKLSDIMEILANVKLRDNVNGICAIEEIELEIEEKLVNKVQQTKLYE